MRIFVTSDIHGDSDMCEAILRKFEEEKADKLLILGDILYHGPRNRLPNGYNPRRVIVLLNDMKDRILAVRGNCDAEVDQMVLDFPIMAEYICIVSGDKLIYATHGHHINPSNPPSLEPGYVLLNGHTHIACDMEYDNYRYMNPGSPSIPKNGSLPSYIIIDDGKLELKTLC